MEDALCFEKNFKKLDYLLRFVSRNNFENLDRIKNFEVAVRILVTKTLQCASNPKHIEILNLFIEELPLLKNPNTPDVQKFDRCLVWLEDIKSSDISLKNKHSKQKKSDEKENFKKGISNVSLSDLKPKNNKKYPAIDKNKNLNELTLNSSLQFIKGVGEKTANLLATRDLYTVKDLLYFFPRRYQGRLSDVSIADLQPDMNVKVEGLIKSVSYRSFRGRQLLDVIIQDENSKLVLKWFKVFGRHYANRFIKGNRISASGCVTSYKNRLQMVHPEIEHIENIAVERNDQADIIPLYLDISGVYPMSLRILIKKILCISSQIKETLPQSILVKRRLPFLKETVVFLHEPNLDTPIEDWIGLCTPWHKRLIYEEFFLLQLAVLKRKISSKQDVAVEIKSDISLINIASELFSFSMTQSQKKVLQEINEDLKQKIPMNRLLQGDVGSGKTAVAMSTATLVVRSGYQVAIMVPTEVLAKQHFNLAIQTLHKSGIRIDLLKGSMGVSARKTLLSQLKEGHIQVIIGTHALIQESVSFKSLALVIIDEQHRFGVMQRAQLLELGKRSLDKMPHILVMTATPIPRSLALTAYADLDISIIDALPLGRKPIKTKVIKENMKQRVYKKMCKELCLGRQAYIVFPLIEESDKAGMESINDAKSAAEKLSKNVFSEFNVGLLHGRMSGYEKEKIMCKFRQGEVQILVTTTVIEVGIDVPNATIIVIENAERFGLSQLHQLRGRVGRGSHKSQCFLISHTSGSDSFRRLQVMEESNDGFYIAEEDLAIRGPGDFIGTRQSGLPVFSYGNLLRDKDILMMARDDAEKILEEDPLLKSKENRVLDETFKEFWEDKLKWTQIR